MDGISRIKEGSRREWSGPVTVQRKQPPGGVTIVMAEG